MFIIIISIIILLLYFIYPIEMLNLGKESLLLWYNSILPVLFPSMILTGVLLPYLLRQNLANPFCKFIAKLFGISPTGLLAVIPGFLCGFPMGSYASKYLLDQKAISISEAQRILRFSNNLGPIYFLTVIAKDFDFKLKIASLLLFYSIPIAYGLIPETNKQDLQSSFTNKRNESSPNYSSQINSNNYSNPPLDKDSFIRILDKSIANAITSITKLAGYIFIARTLLIFPMILQKFFIQIPSSTLVYANAIIEITSGIEKINQLNISDNNLLLIEIPFLVFGGICSIAQTACMIQSSKLSLAKYVKHKTIQGAISTLLSLFIYSINLNLFK